MRLGPVIKLLGLLVLLPGQGFALTSATINANPDQIRAGLFFDGETVTISGQRSAGQPLLLLIVGPQQTQQIARLGKRNGIWMKGEPHTLQRAPGFLAVTGSKPLAELIKIFDRPLAASGLSAIPEYLPTKGIVNEQVDDQQPAATSTGWSRAYATMLKKQSLLLTDVSLQDNANSGQFSTEIHLPSSAPPGTYRVIVFTRGNGQLITATTRFKLTKSGIVSRLERAAFDQPVLYGIAALLFALMVGWVIGILFNR
ncbi:MAG: hypothetical protein DRQ52_01480 [Gammaproteobacteria bacterium]|nr:MAG: hypothetical protein DRQ52_01480 [Gammaproteobacteria bacterium]